MGNSNSRGQGAIDALILALLFAALLFIALDFSKVSAKLFRNVQLSEEKR